MAVPARRDQPVDVVAALPLTPSARSALIDKLGAGFRVVDIREAGDDAELVVTPPCSPQAIGRIQRMFPSARVVVVEIEDWFHGMKFSGPVGRALDAGAAAYYVASSTEALGDFLLGVAGATAQSADEDAKHELGTATADAAIFREVADAMARRARASGSQESE